MGTARSPHPMHPIVVLSLLECMREIDLPSVDDPAEVGARRLGANQTIADQIARYREIVHRRGAVPEAETVSIMHLCGRRPDAQLVFSYAGRRAAALAVSQVFSGTRLVLRALPSGLRQGLGWSVTRRLAYQVFEITMEHEDGLATGRPKGPSHGATATEDGSACHFFGSAVAGLLRALTDFDGAVTHDECVTQGGAHCAWHTRISS